MAKFDDYEISIVGRKENVTGRMHVSYIKDGRWDVLGYVMLHMCKIYKKLMKQEISKKLLKEALLEIGIVADDDNVLNFSNVKIGGDYLVIKADKELVKTYFE